MRKVALTVLILFVAVAPAPVWAEEEKSALDLVNDLEEVVQDDEASWGDKNKAYKAAKDAIEAEADAAKEAEKAGEEPKTPAADRYAEIQKTVADGMRRATLPASGWIMGFFGASLLWGGFSVCLAIARKTGRKIDPNAQ